LHSVGVKASKAFAMVQQSSGSGLCFRLMQQGFEFGECRLESVGRARQGLERLLTFCLPSARSFSNECQHGLGRFECHPQDLADLVGIDVMFVAATEHHGLQPFVHWYFTMLEYRADLNGERFPTIIALIGVRSSALALQSSYLVHATTVGANRTIGPNALFDEFIGSVFVPKFLRSISIHNF